MVFSSDFSVVVLTCLTERKVGILVRHEADAVRVLRLGVEPGLMLITVPAHNAVVQPEARGWAGLALTLASLGESPVVVANLCASLLDNAQRAAVLEVCPASLPQHPERTQWLLVIRGVLSELRRSPDGGLCEALANNDRCSWFVRLLAAQVLNVSPATALSVLRRFGNPESCRQSRCHGDALLSQLVGECIEQRVRHDDQQSVVEAYGAASSSELTEIMLYVPEGPGRQLMKRLERAARQREGQFEECVIPVEDGWNISVWPGGD